MNLLLQALDAETIHPCSESRLREKVQPASSSSFLKFLSPFFPWASILASDPSSVLGTHFPPLSLPHGAVLQSLDSKSGRGFLLFTTLRSSWKAHRSFSDMTVLYRIAKSFQWRTELCSIQLVIYLLRNNHTVQGKGQFLPADYIKI